MFVTRALALCIKRRIRIETPQSGFSAIMSLKGTYNVLTLPEDRSLVNLEGLRLIASVLIVCDHYLQYVHLPMAGLRLAVDLFFVVSGIVIAMIYQGRIHDLVSYCGFVRKRVARLYPLHLCTLAIYVTIGAFVATGHIAPENPEKYNAREIIPNLLMIHAWSPSGVISYNYVSWSISAEFFVYLCFPLILSVVQRGFGVGLLACVALLLVAIALSALVVGQPLTELNWRFGALRAVPSFAFGVWLWVHRERVANSGFLRAYASAVTLIAMLCLLGLIAFRPNDYLMLACVYVVVICALVCDLTGRRSLAAWAPISSRGYLTYSIYMLHTVIATVVISFVFPRLFGRSSGTILAAAACSAALTYAVAYASYWYFEMPLRSLIGGKRPPKPAPMSSSS
jgi:peptidoglycan/LPS O-acetylase OafA/YrhL